MLNIQPDDELTPEKVMEIGQEWIDSMLRAMPVKEVLSHYQPSEVLSHYQPSEILSYYNPNEILRNYDVEQIRAYLEQLQASKN